MEKILFDSHSHISDEAFSDCQSLLAKEIENSQLRICMDIGTSEETSKDCIESAEKYSFCYATVGFHPDCIADLTDEKMERTLSAFDTNPKVVAVGEIGLDYHYEDGAPRELQIHWFEKQLKWAIEHKAPVCIHSRDADADTMEVLKRCGAFSKERAKDFPPKPDGSPDCRILLHCYSGSAELARQYVELGATISLAGPLTFKNARKPKEVAATIDIQNLLVETDSPYMAPEPVRGTTNKPTNVKHVAAKMAEIKGLSYEETAIATMKNACRFYGIEI